MSKKRAIVAQRKRMGVPKKELKRGLDQPTIKGGADQPAAAPAEPMGYRPPETIEEFRAALAEAQKWSRHYSDDANRLRETCRRQRTLLQLAADQLLERSSASALYGDDNIPF